MSEARCLASSVLSRPDADVTLRAGAYGAFLATRRAEPCARFQAALGVPTFRRAVALYRYEPFWMKPKIVRTVDDVPPDTQVLLLELESGDVAVLAPLLAPPFRVSLKGEDGRLLAVADTGDPSTLAQDADLAYVAVDRDLFSLVTKGAAEVADALGTVTLRRHREPPGFVDHFGWCTWDAFYRDVSHERVKEALLAFRRGGVEPRWLILDDGWQPTRVMPTGEERLTGFRSNDKFPGGLEATVALSKSEFRVETFLVWHAVHGYWGGLDEASFPDCEVSTTARSQSPEILAHFPTGNSEHWGAFVGRPSSSKLGEFFDRYHAELATQGVDGVKVDNQASVEALAHGSGGRVVYAAAVRAALERSVTRHFGGRLVNCMSCSTDLIYQTAKSGLTRSSTDFWPKQPASHGVHGHTNALVSLWFGEFIDPDWDMFQSAHPAGAFHAVLRAVSGGPIYVSDKPGAHDFELLRKLVLSDGTTLRAKNPGRPTRDSLFENVLEDPVLFKIWNENECTWVIGAFNARYREGNDPIEGWLSPSDVPTASGDDFAVYLHRAERTFHVSSTGRVPLVLDTLGAEIATIVPMVDGFAPFGLADKLNGGGAIMSRRTRAGTHRIVLRDGGRFLARSERPPLRVLVDGAESEFHYERSELRLTVPGLGERTVEVEIGD
jgi:raffinose synthase